MEPPPYPPSILSRHFTAYWIIFHVCTMITTPTSPQAPRRGAFILFEGVDRCGKTTQCALLLKHLLGLSIAAVAMRFPDRSTSVGQLIDSYLRSGKEVDDRAVHLLFSANRWEASGR